MNTRRNLLFGGAALLAAGGAWVTFGRGGDVEEAESFPLTLDETEWRDRLTPEEYAVLREEETEPPFSSPLDAEKRAGIYACAGCGQDAYDASDKFDSGTGWPSFTKSLEGAIGTKTDRSLLIARTEVHCSNCGGHFGHIFDDGPEPTGKRHCLNGLALDFTAA